ncbi:MAG: hypothetical protein AAGA12_06340 [Pseudomonadota bacterium]
MVFGYIVLFSFPIVVAILFKRCDKPVALVASLLVGYLLLPERLKLDLPMLPAFEKETIPALAAFFILLFSQTVKDDVVMPSWRPKNWLSFAMIVALVVGAVGTTLTNGEALTYGPTIVPGLRRIDALNSILTTLMSLLPFLLARRYLAHPDAHKTILKLLVFAALGYSFLALYEVRMSPQLNNMVYGFFPHSFLQHIRGDGFRPLVFLNHGLWLSIFFATSILAAIGLVRLHNKEHRMMYVYIAVWLLFTLVLSKSLGALLITIVLVPVALLLRTRLQLLICAGIAAVILIYPILRGGGMIPIDGILAWAEGFSPRRAQSFGFRVFNEDQLLERAELKPLFGWGGWNRSAIFDKWGRATSVADGYWIITVGMGGWVRYLSEFGLLCLPVVILAVRARKMEISLETSILILMLTANLVDLIPNATITPLTWMLAGTLWGRIELGRINAPVELPPERGPISYTRFGKDRGVPVQRQQTQHFRPRVN